MTTEQIKAKIFDLSEEASIITSKINSSPEAIRFSQIQQEVGELRSQLESQSVELKETQE